MNKNKTIEQFFKVRRELNTKEVVISNAFKDEAGKPVPWKIKALNIDEMQAVIKANTKGGEIDPQAQQLGIMVASVVSPNLKNAELQDYFGVFDEASLLKALLLPAEYVKLNIEVSELNEIQTETEDVKEVKNF